MKRGITALTAMTLLLVGVGRAGADLVQIPTAAGLNPSDTTTAPYTGADGDFLANGFTTSAGGNTLTFTNAIAQVFLRTDQGTSWSGAYPNGTHLIQNLFPGNGPPNNPGGTNGGPVTISFANPVAEVGLSVQQDHGDAGTSTTFSFTAFTASSSTTFALSAVSNSLNVLSFIGVKDPLGDDAITKLVISSADSSDTSYNNDFVMGPVTFGTPQVAVPEPSALALGSLCALGLVVVNGVRRRRPAA